MSTLSSITNHLGFTQAVDQDDNHVCPSCLSSYVNEGDGYICEQCDSSYPELDHMMQVEVEILRHHGL